MVSHYWIHSSPTVHPPNFTVNFLCLRRLRSTTPFNRFLAPRGQLRRPQLSLTGLSIDCEGDIGGEKTYGADARYDCCI
jgi:hypothetical protein